MIRRSIPLPESMMNRSPDRSIAKPVGPAKSDPSSRTNTTASSAAQEVVSIDICKIELPLQTYKLFFTMQKSRGAVTSIFHIASGRPKAGDSNTAHERNALRYKTTCGSHLLWTQTKSCRRLPKEKHSR